MINKPRSARMLHQRKITVTEHKERTLRWRWRKSNQEHVEKSEFAFLHCFVEEEPYWTSQERMLNNEFEFSERRLKNLEIFGEVGGSEKWKRFALPELLLLRKSGLLAAFQGTDRFACYENRQISLIVPWG